MEILLLADRFQDNIEISTKEEYQKLLLIDLTKYAIVTFFNLIHSPPSFQWIKGKEVRNGSTENIQS
jgi:hypothetical protein